MEDAGATTAEALVEYAGQALRLRFMFYYNPDPREADLQ